MIMYMQSRNPSVGIDCDRLVSMAMKSNKCGTIVSRQMFEKFSGDKRAKRAQVVSVCDRQALGRDACVCVCLPGQWFRHVIRKLLYGSHMSRAGFMILY